MVTTGVVSPISQSAVLHSPTIACVANLHTVVRHSARYDPIFRNWSSDSTEVLRVARQLPFFISQGGSGKPSVIAGVDTDLHAAGLDIYLPTIASNFAPSPPATLGQLALDVLQGERVLGYETTERALPIGTRLTAVGVLDFSRTVSSVENASGWANAGAAVIPAPEGEVSVPLLIAKDGQPFLVSCLQGGSKSILDFILTVFHLAASVRCLVFLPANDVFVYGLGVILTDFGTSFQIPHPCPGPCHWTFTWPPSLQSLLGTPRPKSRP